MTSKFWDEKRASGYRELRFQFPERSLSGRTIAVAGGTGGLGSATALLLAIEGAHLILGYRRNRERAMAVAKAVEKHTGRVPALVEGDIAEGAVRRQFLAASQNANAALTGIVIFSGDPARMPWEKIDRDALAASFDVNFTGPLLLAKDLGETMEKSSSGGSVVLLSTMQALAPFPGSVNYAAPKSALIHAAKILAQQWDRVRVNVVAPGATLAGMAEASVQSGKYDRYVESGAIPRFGWPEDVARAVRFFLEPDNYVTGQVLAVDGGMTLRRDRG